MNNAKQLRVVKHWLKYSQNKKEVITCTLDESYLSDWIETISSMPPIKEMGKQFKWDKPINKSLSLDIMYDTLSWGTK